MDEQNKTKIMEEINETAKKVDLLINNLFITNKIDASKKTEFNIAIKNVINAFLQNNETNENETDENGTETDKKTKQTKNKVLNDKMTEMQAVYNCISKDRKKEFVKLIKQFNVEFTYKDNSYSTKVYNKADLINEIKNFIEIPLFTKNEKNEIMPKYSNNQIKKAISIAFGTSLKPEFREILKDEKNNKKQFLFDGYAFNYSKVFDTLQKQVFLLDNVIDETNGTITIQPRNKNEI